MKDTVKKADVEKRLVWGEVVAPNRPFVPDPQHDGEIQYMSAEDIEELAYNYMARKTEVGIDTQHNHKLVPGCTVVESFIARENDPDFISGSWVICVHVDDDDTWKKIKDGEINGFSMEAAVLKELMEVEIEIPPNITGLTSEVAEHAHSFSVQFSAEGDLAGGNTSLVNGHFHKIVASTITEIADGHRHRFSSVDNVTIVEGGGS